MRLRRFVLLPAAVIALVLTPSVLAAQHQPTIAQFLRPGMPIELVSAK